MNKQPNEEVYLVIGSNNFWYGIFETQREADAEAEAILEGQDGYGDPEGGYEPETPASIHVYRAALMQIHS